MELELDQFQVINEILVPTCSYRMGTSDMGYAAVAISMSTMIFLKRAWLIFPFRYEDSTSQSGDLATSRPIPAAVFLRWGARRSYSCVYSRSHICVFQGLRQNLYLFVSAKP